MYRKTVFTVVSLIFLFGFVSMGFSEEKGNSRKGKHLFRTTCRECHQEGAKAKPLSPDSKTQAQWSRAFEPDKYKELACKAEWEKQSAEDLKDIYTYLYEHAFDSPSPAKCK
jgi:hypothetical protein